MGNYLRKLVVLYFGLFILATAGVVLLFNFLNSTNYIYSHGLRYFIESQDFTAYYTAGQMVRHGELGVLYDIRSQYERQKMLAPDLDRLSNLRPYINPPFVALFFVPFTFLSLEAAYFVWLGVNLWLVYFLCKTILERMVGTGKFRRLFVLVLIVSFPPVVYTLASGQISLLLVLSFLMSRECLRRGEKFTAGAWLGLLMIKPQYVLLPILFFGFRRDWGVLRALLLFCGLAGVGSYLLVGLSGAERYFRFLQEILEWENSFTVSPQFVNTWRGFVQLFFQKNDLGGVAFYWLAGVIVLLCLLLYFWWKRVSWTNDFFDLYWAGLIIGAVLISPYMSGQDKSVLFVAGLLIYFFSERVFYGRPFLLFLLVGWYVVEAVLDSIVVPTFIQFPVVYMIFLLVLMVLIQERRVFVAGKTRVKPGTIKNAIS